MDFQSHSFEIPVKNIRDFLDHINERNHYDHNGADIFFMKDLGELILVIVRGKHFYDWQIDKMREFEK